MWLYVIPFVVFLVMCAIISNVNKKKEDSLTFSVKSIIPSLVAGAVVFFCIKHRQQSHEPMMPGNYFE